MSEEAVYPVVPRPEGTPPVAPIKPAAWIQRWEADGGDVEDPPRKPWQVGGAILKTQAGVARDLSAGRALGVYVVGCLALIAVASVLYGAAMGCLGGPVQALYAAIKFPLVVLGACGLCLPSFYVFQCLMGARMRFSQAVASVLLMAAAASLILIGCVPIVWFFSVSTGADSGGFIVALHVATTALAAAFGIHLLSRMHRYLLYKRPEMRFFEGRVLALWCGMFVIVALQLACYLGPLMHEGEFFTGERKLFVTALSGKSK
ncbi:MAG: hypothetical protein IT462_08505 [Planctomycetes bacterium]|nr:hypothetical protein [Planctomycetota bacterium]